MTQLHHAAICTDDIEGSLAFWRDCLGFAVQFDHRFDGDWPALFGGQATSLRAVFLGDPDQLDAGIVELVDLGPLSPASEPPAAPTAGFFLLSVMVDLASVLERLEAAGLGGRPRQTVTAGVAMATVRDPNGVLVELIDRGARANLGRLAADG